MNIYVLANDISFRGFSIKVIYDVARLGPDGVPMGYTQTDCHLRFRASSFPPLGPPSHGMAWFHCLSKEKLYTKAAKVVFRRLGL